MSSQVTLKIVIKNCRMGMAEPQHFLDEFKIAYINETQDTDSPQGWTWTGTVSTKHFTSEFMAQLSKLVRGDSLYNGWEISLNFF